MLEDLERRFRLLEFDEIRELINLVAVTVFLPSSEEIVPEQNKGRISFPSTLPSRPNRLRINPVIGVRTL